MLFYYQTIAYLGMINFPYLDDYEHLTDFLSVARRDLKWPQVKLHPTYYNSQAHYLHENFTDSLRDLKSVTHKASRQLYVEALTNNIEQATALLQHKEVLSPMALNQLKHITDRALEEHLALASNFDKHIL